LKFEKFENGYGGCLIGSFRKEKIISTLNIPERYDPLLIIALGKPKDTVRLEEIDEGQDIKYYRDEQGIHRVPKRKLENIIIQYLNFDFLA